MYVNIIVSIYNTKDIQSCSKRVSQYISIFSIKFLGESNRLI